MIVRLSIALVLALAAVTAVFTGRADACSCANEDPRDLLERGRPALVGTVVSSTAAGDHTTRYVVRVERSLNARLGEEVVLEAGNFSSSCGFRWRVGQRVATFLYRWRGRWTAHLCTLARPAEIERALRPYPRPLGEGRLALLAGGSFGDARLMALDERGRVLGYGFGGGEVRSISVCPGGGSAAELAFLGQRQARVAVRSLATLEVTSSVVVPGSMRHVACADPGGAAVYAAGIRYRERPVRGTGHVLRVADGSVTTVFAGPAEQVGLGAYAAYVWSRGEVSSVSLADGSVRPLVRVGLPDFIVPSPDGELVAVQDYETGLRLVRSDGTPGPRRSHKAIGALRWIGSDRLLVRVGGQAYVYDRELGFIRRYRFYRAYLEAPFGGDVFGVAGYRLIRLDLDSGRKLTAGTLPDRGIAELAGVPEAPLVDLSRRAPRGFSETGPRTRSARAGRPGARTARWSCARSPRD